MAQDNVSITAFFQLPEEDQIGNGKPLGEGRTCGVWYDWFCSDTSLQRRGRALVSKLKQIKNSKRFDPETSYTFFKNNCPLNGSLYDDFRICDLESGNVIFCVVPKSGHKSMNGLGEVWGKEETGEFGQLFVGTWPEIKKWFNEYQPK